AEQPDATVFNGHATQYVHAPLEARTGERVRLWVLAAGPSRGISFHVVGGVFDTVFKEGAYLLRPGTETRGGAQSLDLAAAQGGVVELVFDEPGTYTAVHLAFADMERGARALIRVTARAGGGPGSVAPWTPHRAAPVCTTSSCGRRTSPSPSPP